MRGLDAAREAGLPVNLNLIVTQHNDHEVTEMQALAENRGLPYATYSNISPTIHSGAETLPSQSAQFLRSRKPFTGCGAGHTHFHVDPHGKASICKVGRDPNVDLMTEGISGLSKLGALAIHSCSALVVVQGARCLGNALPVGPSPSSIKRPILPLTVTASMGGSEQ